MNKILQDIYILIDSGVVIWSRVFDPKINEQIFGALMTAINTFAEQITETGISNFELSNKQYIILQKKGFLFIGNGSNSIKQKKIQEELDFVSERFLEVYAEDLAKIRKIGNLPNVSDFEKHIQPSLESAVTKFQNAFW